MTALACLGLLSTYHSQTLDASKIKPYAKYIGVNEITNEVEFVQFNPNNGLTGSTFFSQFGSNGKNSSQRISLVRTDQDQLGYFHYRFQQYFEQIPIEGGEFTVSQNATGITFAGGNLYQTNKSALPSLNPAEALSSALNFVGATSYKWQITGEELALKQMTNNPLASYQPIPELVWLTQSTSEGSDLILAYKMDIYAHAPLSRSFVYVNANDGSILQSVSRIHDNNANGSGITLYNGTQNFTTDSNAGTFRLNENVSVSSGVNRAIHTLDMNNGTNYNSAAEFTDADNYWTDNTNQDRAGWSAHWAAEATWDFYFYQLGRNSYDGNGGVINQYVHYDNNYNNAFWDGQKMTYGDGDGSSFGPLVSLDVVGHEITHGVTERTSNLVYQNESGALNESFSDIFGTAIEFYKEGTQGDWLIGEDFDVQSGVGFRSMSNPKSQGDPDTYQGTNWKSNSAFPSLIDDYGGVHSNSGVQNHWFYILSVGKSGTNDKGNSYSVTGIGINKAAAIAYRNNATKLSSNSNYAAARSGAIASAIELYGDGSPEVIATTNAWYAVGVGAAYQGAPQTCATPAGLTAASITQTSATLNWTTVSSASNYNLRYRSVGSTTWTNTTSTTNSKSVTGLSAGTNYEFQVQSSCGGSSTSAYSSSATFSTTSTNGGGGAPTNYCTSQGNNSSDEWINRVQFASLDNTSGNNNGYGNYLSTIVPVTAGNSYNFTLTPGFTSGGLFGSSTYPEYWKIWIDYNRDGDFSDAGELAYDAGATATTARTGSIAIPNSASVGQTRMRVQMKYNGASTACEAFGYGEVEDYTLQIQSAAPQTCDIPSNLNSSNISANSADLSWSNTGASNGYLVDYRIANGSWTTLSSASNALTLSNLSANSSYEFRVKSDCGATTSSFSGIANFTTQAAAVCGDVSNLSTSGITTNSAQLNWTAGGNASSYEVQYRTVGGTWQTTTSSGVSKTLSGLSSNTVYNWQVRTVCSFGNSAYEAGGDFQTLQESTPVTYCISKGNSTTDEWIASIQIAGITKTSGNNSGYADFTATSISANAGSSVSFTLTPGFSGGLFGTNSYPEYWRIWIDFNHDGDFTDAGELAFDAGGTSTAAVSGSFVLPTGALLGATRMRLQMKYNAAPTPCETFSYGEVEDYTFNITAGSFTQSMQGTATEAVLIPSKLGVYPNPSTGQFQISSDATGQFRILNMNGSLLYEGVLEHNTRLDLSHLAKGMYVLQLQMGEKSELKKIVLE